MSSEIVVGAEAFKNRFWTRIFVCQNRGLRGLRGFTRIRWLVSQGAFRRIWINADCRLLASRISATSIKGMNAI